MSMHQLDHHDSLPPVFAVRPDPRRWWRGIALGYDEDDPCHAYRCVAVIEPDMAWFCLACLSPPVGHSLAGHVQSGANIE